jgi:hypothetical protein
MRRRDVDSDGGLCTLHRHEQRLERREKRTSHSVRTSRVALAVHRARDRCTPGDGKCLPEGRRHRRATARSLGTATTGKTGPTMQLTKDAKNIKRAAQTAVLLRNHDQQDSIPAIKAMARSNLPFSI